MTILNAFFPLIAFLKFPISYVVYYIHWVSYTEAILNSCDKVYLVILYNPYGMLFWICFANILLYIFIPVFTKKKKKQPVIFFLMMFLTGVVPWKFCPYTMKLGSVLFFYIKYFVEFTSETIWLWTFPCLETFDY